MIKDQYTSNRGGYGQPAKLLCEKCGNCVSEYQKDGAIGPLKRIYVDRITDKDIATAFAVGKELQCKNCGHVLGIGYTYEKENRPAYRMFQSAVKIKYTCKVRYLVCLLRGLLKI